MDQLKPAIAFMRQYGFWIGVAVAFIGATGIWYVVSGDLIAENSSRIGKIKADVSTVSGVRSKLDSHPNPTSHTEMTKLIDVRRGEVMKAWQTVYDAQRDILVWPEEELQKDFVDEFRDLIPIEEHIPFPPGELELETTLLNRYKYYIGNALPAIGSIVGAKWEVELNAAVSASMDGGMDPSMMGGSDPSSIGPRTVRIDGVEDLPLVQWSSTAQSELMKELFPWFPRRPSTLEVYYSQENLWILRQLLEIISSVNGEAKQPFEAKIHVIKRLSMGRRVKIGNGTLSSPGVGAMGGMGMDASMMMDSGSMETEMDASMMDPSMMDPSMMMEGMASTVDPADNRYVDTKLEPITGATLRGALSSEDPEQAPLKVAKRVPVMMSLQIDQRAIPALLAACGSAPLMVEVKQTRVRPKNASASAGGMGGGEMGGMGMSGGPGMGGMEMGGMEMGGMDSYGGGNLAAEAKDPFPLDITVEVYGLIHIYNPPNIDKLADEQVTPETALDGETMNGEIVEPPAAPTPAVEATPEVLPTPAIPSPEAPVSEPAVPNDGVPAPAVPAVDAPASPPADPPAAPVAAPAAADPANPPPPAEGQPAA